MTEKLQWDEAITAIKDAGEVVIACHIGPDGDALGSVLGLAGALEADGKKVWRSWGSGELKVPPQYSWMPGIDQVVLHREVPDEPELFCALDCGDLSRLELLKPKFENAKTSINIDHHASNESFGEINVVDPEASSTSEMIYQLAIKMGLHLGPDEATNLYAGIVTDTGRFQYPSASIDTLKVAAELRSLGVDHDRVAQEIFESSRFSQLHVLGIVLSRAKVDGDIVWSWLDIADLGDLEMEATEDIIDNLKTVREARVAVILKQRPDRSYRVSLRSKGEIDVARIAESFGGGGHRLAAGFNIRATPQGCIDRIKAKLPGA
jgi:phosphoesterase RecJ-like protein